MQTRFGLRRDDQPLIDVRRDESRADLRVLPYVSTPGAPGATGASFVLEDDLRGLRAA